MTFSQIDCTHPETSLRTQIDLPEGQLQITHLSFDERYAIQAHNLDPLDEGAEPRELPHAWIVAMIFPGCTDHNAYRGASLSEAVTTLLIERAKSQALHYTGVYDAALYPDI